MTLLNAKNISHKFDYTLFSDISISLNEKESIAIIGASGSGKSTLLHILSTLLLPSKGEVHILDKNITSIKNRELVNLRKNDLGMIFQSHYLFKSFSAYENLEVASILTKEKIDEELLDDLHIKDVIKQKVTELSGGQQQRISIARVLTKKPRIIFADEPTGNLDKKTAHDVMNLFHTYLQKSAAGMILVTHDEELAQGCNIVYRLENQELQKIK